MIIYRIELSGEDTFDLAHPSNVHIEFSAAARGELTITERLMDEELRMKIMKVLESCVPNGTTEILTNESINFPKG